jgi:tetratricopeptide (TPR) repeat protein
MSQLRVETYRMPGAELGPENPLPLLETINPAGGPVEADPSIPDEDRRYIGYGVEVSILPHRLQDGYTRTRRPMEFPVLVLENETLRATFLPGLGGRLWSLYHKPARRELMYVNSVFQPANLAIRNAWFSGGVEWNAAIRGHSPYTCSPLFAARVHADDGTPVLRMYEWDRIRRLYIQMDAYLPDGSPVLFVRPRLINPRDEEIPMYWWSNIAVPEAGSRVVVPADSAYKMAYGGRLSHIPIPVWDGTDVTYPTNVPSSNDFFYRVVEEGRPWIAALDGDGRGLVQASTPRLRGRKLFVWGMGAGGRRWQEFLAQPGDAYIEIQAGLARTQYECLPMPGRGDWSWLEAYGLMEADAALVHGEDWRAAREHVSRRLDALVTAEELEAELGRSVGTADRAPDEILRRGSGWGALELRRSGSAPPPGLVFDELSIGEDERPWLRLVEDGELPHSPPSEPPGQFMVEEEWRALLERALEAGRGDHWLSWLHLGVMHHHAGRIGEAKEAWERSLGHEESPWALRNLGVVARHEGRRDEAADLMLRACRMRPNELRLAVECCEALLAAERPREMLALASELPESVRTYGRVRMAEASAALSAGDLDGAERVLRSRFELGDIREGDNVLTDLWFEVQERRLAKELGRDVDDAIRQRVRRECPPPPEIDFRMRIPAPE